MKFRPRAGDPVPVGHELDMPVFRWQDEDAVLDLARAGRLSRFVIQGRPAKAGPPSMAKFIAACRARRVS